MKKNVFGRKLKRDKDERRALFKSLISSLVLNERIKTTEAKAKAIRPEIEKLITKAKNAENGAKKVLEKSLSRPAYERILKELGPRFEKRQGGYTRIIKIGERFGDNAPAVYIEFVERQQAVVSVEPKVKKAKKETKEPLKKAKEKKVVKPSKKSVKKETKKKK
jgi:large subunit ribosomal protein L17